MVEGLHQGTRKAAILVNRSVPKIACMDMASIHTHQYRLVMSVCMFPGNRHGLPAMPAHGFLV